MFAWTPALDALCPPIRGQGTPVASKPLDDKKLLAAAGSKSAPNTPAAEAEAFVDAIGAKGTKLVDGIVDRWFAKYGARGAVEIIGLTGSTKPSAAMIMGGTRMAIRVRARHHLAHAADHAEALDFVMNHDGLPPGLEQWTGANGRYIVGREVIAYMFPDHRPLFELAAEQLAAQNFTTTCLLGAVATDEDVGRIHANGIGYHDWDHSALHVAHVTEEAGLARLAEYTSRSTKVVGVARALTAYVSAEAAVTLVRYIEEKPVLPMLREYFTAHPELAAGALEPLTKSKKKKVRETAQSLLA